MNASSAEMRPLSDIPCRYALEHLRQTKGYIIVTTSGMAQLRMPNLSSYAISKLAVNRLVEFVDVGEYVE